MGTEALITVDVVEVRQGVVFRVHLSLPEGAKVAEALTKAVAEGEGPPEWLDANDVGIFARRVSRDESLQHGDRVEVYHPLQLDPMLARRKRSAKRG